MNSDIFSSLAPWRVLVKVAGSGSLSQAAIELDLDVSAVSRNLSKLEKELGADLFDRTKRPWQPTCACRRILERAVPCLAQWDSFASSVMSSAGRKVIRLSSPIGIGRVHLNMRIAEYAAIDPDLSFEVTVNAGPEKVLADEIDVAIVPFTPEHPGLLVYPSIEGFTMPLASIRYVERHGMPESPEDLIRHTGILKSAPHFPTASYLVRGKQRRTIFWKQVIWHNDMLNVRDALLRAQGITVDLPIGRVVDEIKSGEIVQVLGGWHRDSWHYSVVTRASDVEGTPVGKFAAWLATRVKEYADAGRAKGFQLLGIDPLKI